MYTGGLRHRLIKDSLSAMVKASLDDLGWFNDTSWFTKVNYVDSSIDPADNVPVNTVALTTEDFHTTEAELGSDLEQVRWECFVDIYAEDEATGLHLSGDILDILKGKMPNIGRIGSGFNVLDYTQDPSPFIFRCDIEEVTKARVREWEKPHEKFWYVVGGWIIDYYGSEG